MGIKRRLRKKRKKLGGEMRKSVDKSLLADVERLVRPVSDAVEPVRQSIEEAVREITRRPRRR